MLRIACAIAMVIAASPLASACSIPVFRYALERWPASNYDLVVFHKGELTKEQQALLDGIEQRKPSVNVRIETVDIGDAIPKEWQKLWQTKPAASPLPWVAICTPDADAIEAMWSGSLTSAWLSSILDSPARQAIAKHLLAGDTAVFLLLESGDEAADRAAATLLAEQLPKFAKEITLPKSDAKDPPRLSKLPMKIAFSVVRVSRTAEAERAFVQFLRNVDEDVPKSVGPVVCPIFGRGRLLCSLSGKSLTAAELRRAADFLAGACSCRVKELNPGIDLLLAADWDSVLEKP